ncbi:MAG: hypothetical protein V1753_12490 [Pseudomonadota bacterium]
MEDIQNAKKVISIGQREAIVCNFDVLKESPCRRCSSRKTYGACEHIENCPKIEQYQEMAAGNFSLFKDSGFVAFT